MVGRHLPPDAAARIGDPDADLSDLGLESLTLVSLVVDLESTFEVVFPERMMDVETFRTVRTVAQAVQAARR